MRKLLNNPWIVTALAAAAVAFVGISLRSQLAPRAGAFVAATPSDTATDDEAPAASTAPHANIVSALKELPLAATPRDPFSAGLPATSLPTIAPTEPAADAVDTVRLAAVWTQAGKTYVVINNRICQPGDELAPFKIESATQEGVWLTHWKGRDFLTIGHDVTLVTPAKLAAARAL